MTLTWLFAYGGHRPASNAWAVGVDRMQPEAETRVVPARDSSPPPKAALVAVEPITGPACVGRYELIHRLAHGGMATVYLGRAKGKAGFEKVVAIKLIHPHLASEAEFVAMFLDEARIVAQLHHPHVVETLDLGEDDGLYYMVMEFIAGENLAALVRALRGERLPVNVALQIVADTLAGLSAAHELRDGEGRPYDLVHRDVSPHNVLISLDGWAKVGDFGIMKAAGKPSMTKTGQLRGKLAYMAPEQARGGRVDPRTDLFAVGVILWELLTGQRLFARATEAATLEQVMACEVPTLASTGERPELADQPAFAAELEQLLRTALAADPEARFADASAMLVAVKQALRSANALAEIGDQPANEPRTYLGALMHRFFRQRVAYARAALRRTGEHEALSAELRLRPPTGSNPSVAVSRPITGATAELPAAVARPRPPTASNASLTAEVPATRPTPAVQWSLWLLLPMLGAAIAVAAMLLIDRGSERITNRSDSEQAPPPREPQDTKAEDTAEADSPAPPASLASTEFAAPTGEQPEPGQVRWYISSDPPGAKVIIDGRAHESPTPTSVHVPVGEQPVRIELHLAGHQVRVAELTPVNDQSFAFPLDRETDSRKPARGRGNGKRSVAAKTGATEDTASSPKPGKAFLPMPASLRDDDGE